MSTHTPGPWRVAKTGGFDLAIYGRSEKQPICVFAMGDEIDPNREFKNGPANARLIAAAPDMLKALKGVAALRDLGAWEEVETVIVAARAAIAKAEETP